MLDNHLKFRKVTNLRYNEHKLRVECDSQEIVLKPIFFRFRSTVINYTFYSLLGMLSAV